MADDVQPKHPLTSKLVWLGIAQIVVGAAQEVLSYLQNLPVDRTMSVGAIVTGALTIIFRYVTKSPILFPPKK